LPPYMFGIREKIAGGVIPDAYIRSTNGIICIDSKFPLENYIKMREATDLTEREIYKKRFLNDVKGHLDKVRRDYIRPESGTANFAFVYVPSEAIYWFLVEEAFDMVRNYIKMGVHIVSPLTLSHKIEIVKAGIEAKRLSEEAERIKRSMESISEGFKRLDNNWRIFYETHLRNLWNKASEVDTSYRELKRRFDDIKREL
ncbi:MAG: DNA recombination protein RmuC, partial [Synergistetes bacterium]|nr:DNA recombination protein RmuC [Synergistota bacterium]